jgi:hypothetical protein
MYCCIVKACSAADRRVANQYIDQLCGTVGVTMPEIKCGMMLVTSTSGFSFGMGGFSTALDGLSSDMAELSSRLGTTWSVEPPERTGDGGSDTNSGGDGANNGSTEVNSTAIGLGVGLGVGIPLILGVLAFFFFKSKRGQTNGKASISEQVNYAGMPRGFATAVPREKPELAADEVRPKYELQGDDGPRGELPG